MIIRREEIEDAAAIHMVNIAAFDTPAEARLVDSLRKVADPFLSLLAESPDGILGHIAFSPMSTNAPGVFQIFGLGPMAVLPEKQGQGIGSALIEAGLDECRSLDCGAIMVLGHRDYYPKFGFQPARTFGIECEYDVPEEVFMALELQANYLDAVTGLVRYHPSFSDL